LRKPFFAAKSPDADRGSPAAAGCNEVKIFDSAPLNTILNALGTCPSQDGCVLAASRSSRARTTLLVAVTFMLAACHEEKVSVYRIPKENNQASMENGSGNLAPPPPANPATWTKPDSWEEKPLSEMRLGSFGIKGTNGESVDVSVTSFPGDAGGLESNVNRWREQVHQPTLEAERLADSLQRETVDGVPTVLIDVQTTPGAEKPSRILGAIFRTDDRTWFVKLTGPPDLVESQKESFTQFVKSFHFSSKGETTENPPGKVKSTNDR
jgi:hypothetical protein